MCHLAVTGLQQFGDGSFRLIYSCTCACVSVREEEERGRFRRRPATIMEDLLATVAQPEQEPEKQKKVDKRLFTMGRVAAKDGNPFDEDDDEAVELEEVVVDTVGAGHEHAKAGSLEEFYVDVGRINTALADVRRSLTKLSSQFEASTTSTRYARFVQKLLHMMSTTIKCFLPNRLCIS